MTLKTKMSLLVFLTTVSIVSVGFSSWSITAETQAEISGRIEVDNVINTDDCLTLMNEPHFFEYGERGFVDENKKYVEKAIVDVIYTINLDMCKTYFLDFNTLIVSMTLSHNSECQFEENKGLFDTYEIPNADPLLYSDFNFEIKSYINDTNIDIDYDIETNKTYFSFNLSDYYDFNNNTDNTITFKTQYIWWINGSTDYFKNNIYPKIYDSVNNQNKLTFELSSSISGK